MLQDKLHYPNHTAMDSRFFLLLPQEKWARKDFTITYWYPAQQGQVGFLNLPNYIQFFY